VPLLVSPGLAKDFNLSPARCKREHFLRSGTGSTGEASPHCSSTTTKPSSKTSRTAGVAAELAVSRAGDWFGSPVNVASRVTGLAVPGSVLVTESARQSSGVADDLSWSPAGAHRLRGGRGQVDLFRVRRTLR
jgi:hypothetical protein